MAKKDKMGEIRENSGSHCYILARKEPVITVGSWDGAAQGVRMPGEAHGGAG